MSNDREGPETWLARREELKAKGYNANGAGMPLAIAAQLFPTPTAGDAKAAGSRNTPGSKAHAGVSLTDHVRGDGGRGRDGCEETPDGGRTWPTPQAADATRRGGDFARRNRPGSGGDDLSTAVSEDRRMWATPSARDWKSCQASEATHARNSRPLSEQVGLELLDPELLDSHAPVEPGTMLNPEFVEWLMGLPRGWTDPGPEASGPASPEPAPGTPDGPTD